MANEITRAVRCGRCGRPTGEFRKVLAIVEAPPEGLCEACYALTDPPRPDYRDPYECPECGGDNWRLLRHATYGWIGDIGDNGELLFRLAPDLELDVDYQEAQCADCGYFWDGDTEVRLPRPRPRGARRI